MKKDQSKKYAVLAGIFFILPAISAIPSFISLTTFIGVDIASTINLKMLIVLAIDSLISLALGIALFIRKKNVVFVAISGFWLLFYILKCIVLVSGLSINVIFSIFSLAVTLWLFMANCLPKFKKYIDSTKSLWFVPYALNLIISIVGIVNDIILYQKLDDAMSGAISVFSGLISAGIGNLSYLFMGLWLYKSYKNEIENNNFLSQQMQPAFITSPEVTETVEAQETE
ncbi:MAG: hypothetical protein E7557_07050 [Ruminococcaceae bacterium]|nr:hypothetical protein [Oscillospiraceae bacterium]